MNVVRSLITLLLVGACIAAPAFDNDDDGPLVITKDFYIKDFVKYTSKYDIVKILVPLNSINSDESSSSESFESDSKEIEDITTFFVEADVSENGDRVYKGIYSLQNGKAKKVLENGRDAAASTDDSKSVFFGANDGIYIYNQNDEKAVKYGSVEDSIIGIAKEKSGDIIYILTEDNTVYKVSDNGNKKEELDDVVNAKQIILDLSNNLYFLSDDKVPYVRSAEGVKKIEGLPQSPSYAELVRPPLFFENGVMFASDRVVYTIYANGTSEPSGFEFQPDARPSAYAPDGGLIQYYAHDKKIYEFNILALLLDSVLEELGNFLNEKAAEIRNFAAKSKGIRH